MTTPTKPHRDQWLSVKRGFAGKCPHCGEGRIFRAYLKVSDACEACGEELHHQRADDAPPYMTIFVVGHIGPTDRAEEHRIALTESIDAIARHHRAVRD